MKNLIDKIKIWWRERKGGISLKEFHQKIKSWNKSDLIKEICLIAQRQNKNNAGVSTLFKKKLRRKSKKLLIKTLLLMKLENTKEVKHLRKKYAKTKVRGIGKRLYEPMHGVSGHAKV